MKQRTQFYSIQFLAIFVLVALWATPTAFAKEATPKVPDDFKGKIELDIRDSKADWGPFTPKRAPEGAPNVLVILYDDTGLAAWSPYGGRIKMPTLDRWLPTG